MLIESGAELLFNVIVNVGGTSAKNLYWLKTGAEKNIDVLCWLTCCTFSDRNQEGRERKS